MAGKRQVEFAVLHSLSEGLVCDQDSMIRTESLALGYRVS